MQEISKEIKDLGLRLRAIKEYFKLTFSELVEISGISTTALQAIMKGEYKGFDVSLLVKLHQEKPNINAGWLLTGKGEMLNDGQQQEKSIAPGEISDLKKKIAALEKELAYEKRICAAQERSIRLLEEKINNNNISPSQSA